MVRRNKFIATALLTVLLVALLCGFTGKDAQEPEYLYHGIEDLKGKHIGVVTGMITDQIAVEYIPGCVVEYYNSYSDLCEALSGGKIDAFIGDEPIMRKLLAIYPNQRFLTTLMDDYYGFIFPKDEAHLALCEQMNEFIAKCQEDGTLKELDTVWFGTDASVQVVDASDLEGTNGILTLAISTECGEPFLYMKDGQPVGFEYDLLVRFCRAYGYGIKTLNTNFAGVLTAAAAGKADIGASCISITDERKQSMNFSDTHYVGGIVITVGDAMGEKNQLDVLDEFSGKHIALLTGSAFDKVVEEYLPGAKVDYFNTHSDMCEALVQGKVDGIVSDEPLMRKMAAKNPSLRTIAQIVDDEYGIIFPKDEEHKPLLRQMNEFLERSRSNGTLDDLDRIWFGNDEEIQVVDMSDLTGENGTLRFAISTEFGEPFLYQRDGKPVGYEVDLVTRFCRAYGYALEIQDSSFSGVLAAVSAGKADLGASSISITEERKEAMAFSDPHYIGGVVLTISDATGAKNRINGLNDFYGKRIAVLTGAIFDKVAKEYMPDAEIVYYNNYSDMSKALAEGRADAILGDEPILRKMAASNPNQRIMARISDDEYGIIFPKDEKHNVLCRQMNEFLERSRRNGTLDDIDRIWFGNDEETQFVDMSDLTGENGTLRFALSTEFGEPFLYQRDGKPVGYEVDLVTRFCRAYGYAIEIMDSNFSGVLSAVSTGKADIGASCISITEERKEAMAFSDPHYIGGIVITTGDAENLEQTQESSTIAASFQKTFIHEGRWKLFLSGIGVTILITVLSTMLGTALGFGLYLIFRRGNRVFITTLNVFSDILEKTPVVVILMILYYLIFGKASVSGIWVSVIGFTVMFACSFVGTLRVGVGAVDDGQREAALAMGFTDRQSFMKIILPQAARHFLPGYKRQIVTLLKDTAIVGYIAVQDLTKVGDIVRSRTYEAFFPLVVTAVIYFFMAWGLTLIVKRIEISSEPSNRSPEKILKGVKTK